MAGARLDSHVGGLGRKWLAPALALVTLAAVLVIGGLVQLQYAGVRDRQMESAADRIERRIASHLLLLGAIKGLMVAYGAPVTAPQLADFLGVLPESAGVASAQGFGFALATPAARPELALAEAQRSYPDAPAPWPETDQPVRFPIVLLEPQDAQNRRAIGFDMYSEPTRRDAMRRAAATRGFAMTAPLRLVQEDSAAPQHGVLIYLPVFRGEGVATPAPREETPGEVVGFVYTPLRLGDLFGETLAEAPALDLAVAGVDATDGGAHPLVAGGPPARGRMITRPIKVADRLWRLDIGERRAPAFYENPALWILLLGAGMAALFGLLGRAHFRAVRVGEQLAHETRARAELAEVMLGEMRHRIKNSIARKLALFRLSVRESPDKETLAQTFEARMQALARAQDLLLAPPDEGLTIRHLLDDEVAEWRGAAGIRIDGPSIALDGAQLQALALVFHELTTNSLKYGALAVDGALSVTWRVEPAAGGERVVLDWREDGAATTQDRAHAAAGYGSRLIRLMAEGELGGTVTRELTAAGLAITLAFPLRRAGAAG